MYIFIANSRLEKILDFEWDIDFLFNRAYEEPDIFIYLSNVDSYWMTIFNKLQIDRGILKEMDSLKEQNEDKINFLNFLKRVEQHDLLVIVWD